MIFAKLQYLLLSLYLLYFLHLMGNIADTKVKVITQQEFSGAHFMYYGIGVCTVLVQDPFEHRIRESE